MASKTGATWLDCKNPQMADHFLTLAVKVKRGKVKWQNKGKLCIYLYLIQSPQSLETLYNHLASRGEGEADANSTKSDVEKDLLRILSCQAESVSRGAWRAPHLPCERLFL